MLFERHHFAEYTHTPSKVIIMIIFVITKEGICIMNASQGVVATTVLASFLTFRSTLH